MFTGIWYNICLSYSAILWALFDVKLFFTFLKNRHSDYRYFEPLNLLNISAVPQIGYPVPCLDVFPYIRIRRWQLANTNGWVLWFPQMRLWWRIGHTNLTLQGATNDHSKNYCPLEVSSICHLRLWHSLDIVRHHWFTLRPLGELCFRLNIFYLCKRIRHKLNKLMKSSPIQHYLIEHVYISYINMCKLNKNRRKKGMRERVMMCAIVLLVNY